MATLTARELVEKMIQERQEDIRFDLNCRVEVWVTADDIESTREYSRITNDPQTPIDERVVRLKALAVQLAQAKLQAVEGVEITCDGPALSDANIDRIDWRRLARNDAERHAIEAGSELI